MSIPTTPKVLKRMRHTMRHTDLLRTCHRSAGTQQSWQNAYLARGGHVDTLDWQSMTTDSQESDLLPPGRKVQPRGYMEREKRLNRIYPGLTKVKLLLCKKKNLSCTVAFESSMFYTHSKFYYFCVVLKSRTTI